MKIPIIGIDPAFRKDGFRTVVIDEDGVVMQYRFHTFADFIKWIMSDDAPQRAIACVENSNLDKKMYAYHRAKTGGALATAARNVGANQAVSQCTYDLCAWKWPGSAYQITPGEKGKVWSDQIVASVLKSEAHRLVGKLDTDGKAAYQCALKGMKLHAMKKIAQ